MQGEKLTGFSTDGPGFARAIRAEFGARSLRPPRPPSRGGRGSRARHRHAVRLEKCERLLLVNRTFARAEALATELWPDFPQGCVQAIPWSKKPSPASSPGSISSSTPPHSAWLPASPAISPPSRRPPKSQPFRLRHRLHRPPHPAFWKPPPGGRPRRQRPLHAPAPRRALL